MNLVDDEACEKISVLSGNDKNVLYSKSYHSMLKNLNDSQIKMWFHRSGIKYCPKCLADNKAHQYLWELKPISMCAKHNVFLIDTCPGCYNEIQMHALIRGNCSHCYFHLEFAEPLEIKQHDYIHLAQYQFQQLINGDNKKGFRGLTSIQVMILFDSLFRVFDGFESFVDTKANFLGSKIKLKSGNQEEYAVSFANMYWMVVDNFPNHFIHALNVFYRSDSSRKKYRKRHFLNFISNHGEFDFIKKELESFKETQIRNGMFPRNIETFDVFFTTKRKQLYYTKRDLFKNFNISKDEIEKMCESNLLRAKKVVVEAHTNYYFGKQETDRMLKAYLL
ncbi:TniQ family protein [Bacillus sp. FJAT-29814]|uniref:TniQ family protein n=1 Tax=Bacillus sp. FJAT-29814 TaxID=1729688 RepID=UPI001560ED0F|nr:TniQ family protein [Bacillus sp. FJAT-29814]